MLYEVFLISYEVLQSFIKLKNFSDVKVDEAFGDFKAF
jgi:hypothetical protein